MALAALLSFEKPGVGLLRGIEYFRQFGFHCVYRECQLQLWLQIPLKNVILHAFENRSLYLLVGTDISVLPFL